MVCPNYTLHNYLISILSKYLKTCFSPYSSYPTLQNSPFPFAADAFGSSSLVFTDPHFKSNLNSILFFLFAAELDIPISSMGLAGC